MLSPGVAVDLVSRHLRDNGYEVEPVEQVIGGTPTIRTVRLEREPGLRITFPIGVSSCCGAHREPRDWTHTIEYLRRVSVLLPQFEVELNARTSETSQWLLDNLDILLVLEAVDDELQRECIAVVVSGSIAGRQDELDKLAAEFGIGLVFIDDFLAILSAGLRGQPPTKSADA